jgi:flagellar basal body L-ring protein FlgH
MKLAIVPAIGVVLMFPVLVPATGSECPKNSQADSDTYFVVHNIADLPVWRSQGMSAPRFAPEVLVAHVRSVVDPASWDSGAEIRSIEDKASLVIRQTQANHEKIADLLQSFRKDFPGEFGERVTTPQAAALKQQLNRSLQINDIITVTANSDEMAKSRFFDSTAKGATFRIAAEIVDVRPNGNLVIEARRDIKDEKSIVRKTLAGVIRPASLDSSTRTVSMNEISELRLETWTALMETNAR